VIAVVSVAAGINKRRRNTRQDTGTADEPAVKKRITNTSEPVVTDFDVMPLSGPSVPSAAPTSTQIVGPSVDHATALVQEALELLSQKKRQQEVQIASAPDISIPTVTITAGKRISGIMED
jgi:hypothetical protein